MVKEGGAVAHPIRPRRAAVICKPKKPKAPKIPDPVYMTNPLLDGLRGSGGARSLRVGRDSLRIRRSAPGSPASSPPIGRPDPNWQPPLAEEGRTLNGRRSSRVASFRVASFRI